jgi:hypothetical protein
MKTEAPPKQADPIEPPRLELPKAAEKRFAFYAVYLRNERNERGETGPYKAVPIEDYKTSLVMDPANLYEPLDPRKFADAAEIRRIRENPQPLVHLDKFGHPRKFERRAWRLVHNRDSHLFEDELASLANRPGNGICDPVYRVQLWCPVIGRDFLGNREEHGEFLGVGEETAGVGQRQKRRGVCPKCVRDESLDRAAEVIEDQIKATMPERGRYV